MRLRSFVLGLLVVAGSVLAAVVLRRRGTRRRERAEIYLADGTLIALTDGQPVAERLLEQARELLATARS
jgi:xanthine/CO dehydrogenase XdhC/CoxF family maturation factor